MGKMITEVTKLFYGQMDGKKASPNQRGLFTYSYQMRFDRQVLVFIVPKISLLRPAFFD